MKKRYIWLAGMIAAGTLAACSPSNKTSGSGVYDYLVEESTEERIYVEPGPNNPEDVAAMLFVFRPNSGGTELERVTSYADKLTEQALVDKLIEYGVLDEGTEILSFEKEGVEDNASANDGGPLAGTQQSEPRIGYLNLSAVPELEGEEERVMLNCIAATFIDNYLLDEVKLQVNGADYESEYLSPEGDLVFDMKYKNIEE